MNKLDYPVNLNPEITIYNLVNSIDSTVIDLERMSKLRVMENDLKFRLIRILEFIKDSIELPGSPLLNNEPDVRALYMHTDSYNTLKDCISNLKINTLEIHEYINFINKSESPLMVQDILKIQKFLLRISMPFFETLH